MLKHKILGVGFVGAVLAMLAIGSFAFSFHAHAAAPSVTTTVHAYIIKTNAGVVFKRTAITLSLKATFEFSNETNVSQAVTSRGQTVATIAAHSSSTYTFKAAGTYYFRLASNRASKLTVTVT